MTDKERQFALGVLKSAYPDCADADDKLLAAIVAAVATEREACAKVAESYGVVGWLVCKDDLTIAAVHDTQRIVARAIRQRTE